MFQNFKARTACLSHNSCGKFSALLMQSIYLLKQSTFKVLWRSCFLKCKSTYDVLQQDIYCHNRKINSLNFNCYQLKIAEGSISDRNILSGQTASQALRLIFLLGEEFHNTRASIQLKKHKQNILQDNSFFLYKHTNSQDIFKKKKSHVHLLVLISYLWSCCFI